MPLTLNDPLIAGAGAAFGWFANHWLTSRREEFRRQMEAQLKFVERQIDELYGPLAALLHQGEKTLDELLIALGRSSVHIPDKPFPPKELKIWYFWVESEFLPRNEKIKTLIETKAHLVDGSRIPNSYVSFLDHCYSLAIRHRRFKEQGVDFFDSGEGFPKEFQAEVIETFNSLKRRHEELLGILVNRKVMQHELKKVITAYRSQRYEFRVKAAKRVYRSRLLGGLDPIGNWHKTFGIWIRELGQLKNLIGINDEVFGGGIRSHCNYIATLLPELWHRGLISYDQYIRMESGLRLEGTLIRPRNELAQAIILKLFFELSLGKVPIPIFRLLDSPIDAVLFPLQSRDGFIRPMTGEVWSVSLPIRTSNLLNSDDEGFRIMGIIQLAKTLPFNYSAVYYLVNISKKDKSDKVKMFAQKALIKAGLEAG